MKKRLYLLVILTLLPSLSFLARPSSTVAAGEDTNHFSNRRVSAQSGDCGGYDLWLTKSGQSFKGQLAFYEGSCETKKWDIESVQYDPKTGALSFKAPYFQDFNWEFMGTLKKNRVLGMFKLFEKGSKEETSSNKVVLKAQ